MGSSECAGVKEGGTGSIVWVRRRNGSWWPGKILGPDELSASHLMSPRSGTPVKLLGREDASVDWYNLEKSKRVKAFRCGEFDDCIERAEASLGFPAKKREKYARREDAILHALELEKQFLERKYGNLLGSTNPMRENPSDSERKDLVTSSGVRENGNAKHRNHESCKLDTAVDISNLVARRSVPLHMHKAKDGTHPSLEEHDTDLNCQIKELHTFGLKAVPTSRMIYTPAASEDHNRKGVDGHAYGVPTSDPCFENSSDSGSRNSLGKQKRPLEGFVEEPLPKRRDRLHSFVKVRQNNAELNDISLHPDVYRGFPLEDVHRSMYMPSESHEIYVSKQGGQMETPVSRLEVGTYRSQRGAFAEETTSGSSEETESDSSETHSQAHVETGAMLSDAETRFRAQPRILERLQMPAGHESTSSDESDELSFDDRSQFYYDPTPAAGVSKWQLKGKRNVRNINKKPIDRLTHGTYLETKGRSMGQRPSNHSLSYYHDNGYTNDADFMEADFEPHLQRFSKRGYLPSQAAARRHSFTGQNMIDWEELTWGRPLREYYEERVGCLNPMFGSRNGHNLLIDVDLQVQANRQGGEHVPWVSLMSRLNGKAIIGHPIQIETLEDGLTDILVSTSDACGNERYEIDGSRTPPVWRTAKRTANFRVPRPHRSSSSQLDANEDDDNQYIHQSGKVRSKKQLASNSVRKGILMKNPHSPHVARSPFQGMKKPSRKLNLSSNQKTKTLSSIGFDQKFPTKRKEDDTSYCADVIKPVDSGPPTVACIPVKLVFSRLLEAVGRPPAAPAKLGVSVNSNKERNPA